MAHREGMAEKFLKDSLIVPDLRTNPLMLSYSAQSIVKKAISTLSPRCV